MSVDPGSGRPTRQRAATVVVSDLKGSTALAERLDPEILRAVLTRYFDAMRAVIEPRGGTVVKIIGDAIVAVFEDDEFPAVAARRAAAAVLACQAALVALNEQFDERWGVRLEHRTGIASGLLTAGDLDDDESAQVLAGDVVGIAESLEAAAPVGGALVGPGARTLLGDAAVLEAVGPVTRRRGEGTIEGWLLLALTDVPGPVGVGPGGSAPITATNRDSRRTVTIVFADPGPERLDGLPLDARTDGLAMSRYFDVMGPILTGHGGTVEKFIGDAVMAVFGLPVRHEDDAARAVRAAADMRAALPGLNAAVSADLGVVFRSPIGVNTGNVVAGESADGDRMVTGDAVNVAARLEQTAAAGEVVIGGLTHELVGDVAEVEALEPLRLKGKAEPVPAYRLVRIGRPGTGVGRHALPLVGRTAELLILEGELADAIGSGSCRRVTVIGDAGTGKSRVIEEFVARAGTVARIVRGNCLAYGEGITFWPLLRALHDAAAIHEDDDATAARGRLESLAAGDTEVLDRLAALAGLAATIYPVAELEWAFRRTLHHLAVDGPVVVLLDDVHWAEPTLLELVDRLVGSVEAPVLVVCSARPTVLEQHREFVDAAPVVAVEPLSAEDCEAFLRLLLGGSDVDARVITGISEASGGNPLFIGQLLSMLMDDGRLEQADDGWTVRGDLSTFEIPATVEAVLAARLDRLTVGERRTIGPASVIGRRFAVDALDHVLEAELRPGLDDQLIALSSRDLVVAETDDEPAFRFEHQLIRDATYNTLLKESRAILHEQFVEWAEAKNAERDRGMEFEEILGYHLEQAHRYWIELGVTDDRAIGLGLRASQRLGAAGERALTRGDMAAASNLLGRAAALIPDGREEQPRALLLAANALHEIGEFDRSIETYEQSGRSAEAVGNRAAAVAARMEGLRLRYLTGRVEDVALIDAQLDSAREALGDDPDPDALSRIWQLRLNLAIAGCHWNAAQHAAQAVIEQATAAGNDVLAIRTMPLLAFLAQKGPMPVVEATPICETILRLVADDRRSSSMTKLELAMLSAMALDVEHARLLYAETRATLGDLGWEMQSALVSLSSGPIELLADEPARAEAELRRDYDTLERMGERNFISLTAVLLADAVYRQGRFDEAQELVAFSESIVAPDDVAVLILVGAVSGKLAARRGDVDIAIALVEEAVRMMASTDDPSGLGDVLLDHAEVLRLVGDGSGAAATVAQAEAAYRVKGNRSGLRRVGRRRAIAGDG